MAIRLVQIIGFNSCSGFILNSLSDTLFSQTPNFTQGANIVNTPAGNDIINLPTLHIYSTSGTGFTAYGINGVSLGSTPYVTSDTYDFYGLAFAVDDEQQLGSIVCCYKIKDQNYYYCNCASFSSWSTNAIYQAIIGAEQPLYTWESVTAISGKMGILSLSQVASAYLNDGEPVASAPRSYISVLSAASNVGNLVLGASLDMTKVVATYFIPDDISQEADYIKLVYKVNSEPESVSDGTAITITSGQTQTIIDSICDGNTYYFKIFTDEYTSNTVIITT